MGRHYLFLIFPAYQEKDLRWPRVTFGIFPLNFKCSFPYSVFCKFLINFYHPDLRGEQRFFAFSLTYIWILGQYPMIIISRRKPEFFRASFNISYRWLIISHFSFLRCGPTMVSMFISARIPIPPSSTQVHLNKGFVSWAQRFYNLQDSLRKDNAYCCIRLNFREVFGYECQQFSRMISCPP